MARDRKYEIPTQDERDYPADFAEVRDGGGTPMHAHFGEWVADKTGAKFSTQKELAAFQLGAQFGIRYRMNYQRAADGAHAFHEDQRAARDEAAAAKPKRAPKAAPVEEEAPAPKRRGRPAKVEPVEEAPAPKRRGRPAKAASAETGEPKASASARPARRPAASGRAGAPARRGKGGTEPAF